MDTSQQLQHRDNGTEVRMGQRWQHRITGRIVVIVGFMQNGWRVQYRTADDPKSNRLSTSMAYTFTHHYQRHPCAACGSLMHATSDCSDNGKPEPDSVDWWRTIATQMGQRMFYAERALRSIAANDEHSTRSGVDAALNALNGNLPPNGAVAYDPGPHTTAVGKVRGCEPPQVD